MNNLGLPQPSAGSGCSAARKSARPFRLFRFASKAFGLALWATAYHPSASRCAPFLRAGPAVGAGSYL
ncbi:hypothetical protein SGRA_1451 [Saprospira grandis str. Lewin]|uniref:Uncharacterized protein n=1 Tax=Saprospira grandis (strain Lewin) TaxID=984262 RepID=H6L7W5_SAPGL|nr:hypothetical protein SGRA_1451 [Saprospira grandis str. Lewin]